MSVIDAAIPPQSFERVRDIIGAILADELSAQKILTYDEVSVKGVWIERTSAFDKEEVPAVNVALLRGDPRQQSNIHVDGVYRYAIDCYTKAKATDAVEGDQRAMYKLHRLLGVCRSILEDPKYKTLGVAPPFLGNRHIESLGIADPGKQDATNTMMGRLIGCESPGSLRPEDPGNVVQQHDNSEVGRN